MHHPFLIQWKIKQLNLQQLQNGESAKIRSKRLQISANSKYYLSIYPKRNPIDTFIFINVEINNDKQIECKAKIEVESAGISKNYQYLFKKSMGHGIDYCLTNDLFDPNKKFFMDGEMTIKVEGVFIFDEIDPNDSSLLQNNKKNKILGHLFWDRDDKDFVICTGESSITAHKHILTAQSPVFEAMFKHTEMKEAMNNKIDIPNYEFETVKIAVKLCYDLEIPTDELIEHSIELYQFLDQYQMESIRDTIETHLTTKISPSNVCKMVCSSSGITNSKLFHHSFNYLLTCMKETTAVTDLDLLDKETALKLLKNAFSKDV